MAVIETRALRKSFGPAIALDGLDLVVEEGEVHGFLGPNGAGKSTTLRVLLGLLRADGGDVTVLGRDPWAQATEIHRDLAYVPADVTLWPNLTGGEMIDVLSRLRGEATPRRDELIERFALDPTKKGRSYSTGNRQKVALIAALASPARLLILDEPTSGLDPLMEQVFQEELMRVKEEGRTVLLSSHILSEVEKACAKVTIVRAGKVVDSGTLQDLRHLTRTRVRAEVAAPGALTQVASWEGVYDVGGEGHSVTFSVDEAHLGAALDQLNQLGLTSLTANPPSLEDLFLERYRESSAP